MTRAAYLLSKDAEVLLAPYVQLLLGEDHPPEISSPAFATPWDYRFGDLFLDLKLVPKALVFGQVADQTLKEIRSALQKGIFVVLFIPPRLYLLGPWDITWDGTLESLLTRPSVLLPKEVVQQVWELYDRMTS